MVKPVFRKVMLMLVAGVVMLAFLSVPGAYCQANGVGEAGYHNQRGIEYFKKGFYDHTPKNQVTDAEMNYGLAVKEFTAAIARDPFFTDAHRNLARVYYIRKNFYGAAEEYRRVTELAPGDLDAYVNLALALIELNRPDEAVQALENAKYQTSDPKIRDTLDGYIAKVPSHEAKGVR
jgi:tetratricopeptide (TPR) repeat protein